jgi:hypothetical protein
MTHRPKAAIGGFLQLALNEGDLFHEGASSFNTGRNALRHLLAFTSCRRLHLPDYLCPDLFDALRMDGIELLFLELDHDLELVRIPPMEEHDRLLYVDYFGIKRAYCEHLAEKVGAESLIIDATHSYYTLPIPGVATIYSARKFHGVGDGAFLYTPHPLPRPAEREEGRGLSQHLMGRLEKGPESFFPVYQDAEEALSGLPVRQMSALSEALLRNIDETASRTRRLENFSCLHSLLSELNGHAFTPPRDCPPIAYPFLHPEGERLRARLIEQRIYVPTFWRGVLDMVAPNSAAATWTRNLVPLPIDPRYERKVMTHLAETVQQEASP